MNDVKLKRADGGHSKKFAYMRLLFAAFFVAFFIELVCFDTRDLTYADSGAVQGGVIQNADTYENAYADGNSENYNAAENSKNNKATENSENNNADKNSENYNAARNSEKDGTDGNSENNQADENGLTRGRVRLLTEKIYFLENTELQFLTYGNEKVDSVTYSYKGINGFSMGADGGFFIRICWTDGFSGGEDDVEITVVTNYEGAEEIKNSFILRLIFYDAAFRYSDGGVYYINGAPASLFPELKTETPELNRERFGKNLAENISAVKIYAENIVQLSTDKNGNTVRETLQINKDLTSAVFPYGISGKTASFFNALTEAFGEEFSEIYEIEIEVRYFSTTRYAGYNPVENLIKTLGFTLRRLEKNAETQEPMISALKSFAAATERGGAIDAGGLKAALNLDETTLNSFDTVSLVCEIFKGTRLAATLTLDLKDELSGGSYRIADAGGYTFIFSLYLDGELFLSAEAKKNIPTPFFESLDIDGSPEGAFKAVTLITGAVVLLFIALAAAATVYRKRSEAKAEQKKLLGAASGGVLPNKQTRKNENGEAERKNYGGGAERTVLNDRARKKQSGEAERKIYGSGAEKTVLNDYSYDYESGGYDAEKTVLNERARKKQNGEAERKIYGGGAERTVLNDYYDYESGDYDYLYEDEPTNTDREESGGYDYLYKEKPINTDRAENGGYDYLHKEKPINTDRAENGGEKNEGGVKAEKNKNAADIKEEKRGFSYEQLIREKKKFSLGERPTDFDRISENYASGVNGNALKNKLNGNSKNNLPNENDLKNKTNENSKSGIPNENEFKNKTNENSKNGILNENDLKNKTNENSKNGIPNENENDLKNKTNENSEQ
jgi:hypothetical protein